MACVSEWRWEEKCAAEGEEIRDEHLYEDAYWDTLEREREERVWEEIRT